MSGKVGLPNNGKGTLIGGWIGVGGSKAKLLNGWVGDANNHPKLIYTAETPHDSQVITSSGTFTVPSGVTNIDIFCVGGAGGSCTPSMFVTTAASSFNLTTMNGQDYYGDGITTIGGSGYTATALNVPVTSGETLMVSVGDRGNNGNGRERQGSTDISAKHDATDGGTSSVSRGSTVLCIASGGKAAATPINASSGEPTNYIPTKGGAGGSGGRSTGLQYLKTDKTTGAYLSGSWARDVRGNNGFNGGDATADGRYEDLYSGNSSDWDIGSTYIAQGQGSTTKAFGESSGTLYDNFGESGTVIIRW